MRRPNEHFSQRRLVYELRALIDRGRMEEAASVALAHPRAIGTRYVLHNLGRDRATRLGYVVAMRARSLASFDA